MLVSSETMPGGLDPMVACAKIMCAFSVLVSQTSIKWLSFLCWMLILPILKIWRFIAILRADTAPSPILRKHEDKKIHGSVRNNASFSTVGWLRHLVREKARDSCEFICRNGWLERFLTFKNCLVSQMPKLKLPLVKGLLIKYLHWRTEIHKCLSTEWQKSKIAFSLKYRNPKVPFHWITEIQKYLSTELQKS